MEELSQAQAGGEPDRPQADAIWNIKVGPAPGDGRLRQVAPGTSFWVFIVLGTRVEGQQGFCSTRQAAWQDAFGFAVLPVSVPQCPRLSACSAPINHPRPSHA